MDNKIEVYISCPIPVSTERRNDIIKKVERLGYLPTWWTRNTEYKDTNLRDASKVVFMSVDNKFDYMLDDMTPGCRKELALAKSLGKELYIAYDKGLRGYHIYPINMKHLEEGRVLGMNKCYMQEAPKNIIINNYSIY